MIDPTKAQSKAEASRRLAEIAKTERARELFRQLAEDYEKRARGELTSELIEQAEAAPALMQVAPLVSEVLTVVPDTPAPEEIPVTAEVPLVPEISVVADTPAAEEIPPAEEVSLVPETPPAPQVSITETEHFLAVLKAFREDAARGG